MPSSEASRARMSRAVPSGSSGSNARVPASRFDASTPALAQTKPWRVSAITRSPRRATTRTVSASTASARSSPAHDPAFGLRDDLRCHDDHVAVSHAQISQRGHHERRQVVSRPNLGERLRRPPDLDAPARHGAASSTVRASRSDASSSCITVSVTTTRIPMASMRGASARSRSSMTHAPSSSSYARGRSGGGHLEPDRRHQPVGHAGERRAADDAAHAHDGRAARPDRAAHAGDGEDRPEGDDGVRRWQHDEVGLLDRLHHAGSGARRVDAVEAHALDVIGRRVGAPSTPGSAGPAVLRWRRRRRRCASRPDRR